MSSGESHSERLDIVAAHICATGARTVLDLGCGPGELIERLVTEPAIERIVGIDSSAAALGEVGERFAHLAPRVDIRRGSYDVPDPALVGFDAAAMVETIEHVDANRLGEVTRTVFGFFRPRYVVLTTPNKDFNPLYGLQPWERRHPDHRFEWGRARFREWARRVAAGHGYRVTCHDIGELDPELGAPTQMARFERVPDRSAGA